METRLRVIEGEQGEGKGQSMRLSPEQRLRVFRNMAGSMTRDALGVWSQVYGELEGKATHGAMIIPEAEHGFVPDCGWPEFMERMWLLHHYLDHLQRICEGKA